MKILKIFTPIFLSFSLLFSIMSPLVVQSEDISTKILRLHILANSDTQEDQTLKLKVRDNILENCDIFDSCKNINDAKAVAKENIPKIKQIANKCINENGYNYSVKVNVVYEYFNTRVYEKITLPAGYYNSLKIEIGSGEGHNWWCIVFPSVCLSACGDDEMRKYLTDDEIDLIDNRKGYSIRFKAVELYEDIKSNI